MAYKVIFFESRCNYCASGHCGECSGGYPIEKLIATAPTLAQAKEQVNNHRITSFDSYVILDSKNNAVAYL